MRTGENLSGFGAVAVDGDAFAAEFPGLEVGLLNIGN